MALAAYISATQSLIGDLAAQRFTTAQLTTFINTGRSQIALQGECVRFNFGVDGITLTGSFTSGSPTISSISPALSTLNAGDVLTANGGWNIYGPAANQGTVVNAASSGPNTITMSQNATQTGTFTFIVGPSNNTVNTQEYYALPTSVCLTRGIANVVGVRGVSVAYGGFGSDLYTMRYADWSWFQAYLRSYPSFIGNPAYWARYQNSVVLRPIPSSVYPMLWDCTCSVISLASDSDPEAIPYSFTDAIPYFAARLAFLQAQRKEDAETMRKLCDEFVTFGRRNIQSTMVPDIYATVD